MIGPDNDPSSKPQGTDYLGQPGPLSLDNPAGLPVGTAGGMLSGEGSMPTVAGSGVAPQPAGQSGDEIMRQMEAQGIDPLQLITMIARQGGNLAGLASQILGETPGITPGSIGPEVVGPEMLGPDATMGQTLGDILGTGSDILGGVGGLLGAVLAGREGQAPQAITSGLQGISSLLGLAPEGATLGGIPITAAAAGEGVAAGAGGAAGTAGAMAPSIAGAMAWPLLPVAMGIGLHPLFDEWGRPSMANRQERRNSTVAAGMGQALGQTMDATENDPGKMLGLSTIGPEFGQGQVQFIHDTFGHGGDYDDPMNPAFQQALQRASSGDPNALREFIQGINIMTGHTGATSMSPGLTDFYRRELAGQGGLTDTTGLFGPGVNVNDLVGNLLNEQWVGGAWDSPMNFQTIEQLMGGGLETFFQKAGDSGQYIPIPISQQFRQPGELQVAPGQRYALGQLLERLRRDQTAQNLRGMSGSPGETAEGGTPTGAPAASDAGGAGGAM